MALMNIAPERNRKSAPEPIVNQPRNERKAFLAVESDAWTWEELRDYVVTEIQSRGWQQPRNLKTEPSIFQRFKNKWGSQAGPIAQCAFTRYDGWWMGAPISINRFCKGSDPYFAEKIVQNLED